MTNAEIREMQERAARWKMKEDQEKKQKPPQEPPATEVVVGQVDKTIAQQIIERKREKAKSQAERAKAYRERKKAGK